MLFTDCSSLPMWNFFKVCETGDFKYLVRKNRFDYDNYYCNVDLTDTWEAIILEYGKLERSSEIEQKVSKGSKLIFRRSQYLCEVAMLKSISLNPGSEDANSFVLDLISRGYKFKQHYTDLLEFYEDVKRASKRVNHHIPFIQMIEAELKETEGNKENPFDSLMAWMSSEGINVSEDITIKRYLEVKKIINGRNKQGRLNKQRGA